MSIHVKVQMFDIFEKSKPYFKICSYLQKMTLNHTETRNTSIYTTKISKIAKSMFGFQIFPKSIFFKN